MSFKAVVIADTHLTTVNKYGVIEEGMNSRLKDNLEGIKKSVELALEGDYDYWIHLGDVFHSINPSEKLRQLFFQAIKPILGKIPIIILVGNHDTNLQDTYSLMSERGIIDTLAPGMFKLVKEPTFVKLKGEPTLLLPWVEEHMLVESLKGAKGCIVFGHLTVKGAQPSGTEFILKEGLTPKLFNEHRMAFLGHYHKHQSASKWMYLGSSYKLDMGQRDQMPRFLSLHVDGDNINWEFEYVDGRGFVQATITEEDEALVKFDKGSILKLTYEGSKSWVYSNNFKSIKKELLEKGAHKVIIDTRVIRADIDKSNQLNYEPGTTWDKIITKFAESKEKPEYAELAIELFKDET